MLAYTFNPRRQADLCKFKDTQSYISEILSKNRKGEGRNLLTLVEKLGID